MEERRPRQNPPGYTNQQGTLLPSQASSYPVVSAPERFRPPPLSAPTPPTSAPSSGSRAGASNYGYGYGEGPQFGSSMPPPGVYGAQDYGAEQQQQQQQQQSQRAAQHYSAYGPNVMYSVAGAQGSAPGSAQYEPVEQFQQNRDSAIQVLSTGFGVTHTPYYTVPGESGPTSAPASAITPNVPSQYPSLGYTPPQAAVGRAPLAPAYTAAGMTDPNQTPAQAGYQAAYGEQSSTGHEYDDFYQSYQTELKKTFEHVRDGRLAEAAEQLHRLSDWLLQWAETLGLVRDDESHAVHRLKLWEEFNTCWLATLQKQKQFTQELASTGQSPQPPRTMIDYDFLEKMGGQLVKNCDTMEKHGLVDYQMGVWEEEIIAMLTSCLDLLDELGASSSSQRPTSTARRR